MRSQVKTGKLSKARENASDQITFSFRLTSDWFKAWREFLEQSQTKQKQNQNNLAFLSTINWNFLESSNNKSFSNSCLEDTEISKYTGLLQY